MKRLDSLLNAQDREDGFVTVLLLTQKDLEILKEVYNDRMDEIEGAQTLTPPEQATEHDDEIFDNLNQFLGGLQ